MSVVTRSSGLKVLLPFFVLVFAVSWLVWGSSIAQERDLLGFHVPASLAFWLLLPAVLLFGFAVGGFDAVRDLVSRLLRWRVSPWLFALAVGLPILLALASAAIAALLGSPVEPGRDEPLGAALGYLAFGVVFFGLTEELAWRGFALPRLQQHLSALNSSIVIGVLWGAWHLPLWFIADSAQRSWFFPAFVVFTIAESVLIGWVFNTARGSVLLAAIFHAASDAALAYSGVLYADGRAFWVAVVTFSITAAVVAWWAGPGLARVSGGASEAIPTRLAESG